MERVSGNIYIRPMTFALKGTVVDGHSHNFDHTTYVVRGGIRIEKLDENGDVVRTVDKYARDGHNSVLILAGVCHRITALEDDSEAHCIYSHRNPQGAIVEKYEGWDEAYV